MQDLQGRDFYPHCLWVNFVCHLHCLLLDASGLKLTSLLWLPRNQVPRTGLTAPRRFLRGGFLNKWSLKNKQNTTTEDWSWKFASNLRGGILAATSTPNCRLPLPSRTHGRKEECATWHRLREIAMIKLFLHRHYLYMSTDKLYTGR